MGLGSFLSDVLDPGDIFGRKAQEEANDIQQRTTARSLADQKDMFGRLQEDKAPVLGLQQFALDYLDRLGRGEATLATSPGLGNQIEDQQDDLRAMMAARGKFGSGERFMGEQDIAAGLTSQDTSQGLNRLLNAAGFATGDTATQNNFLSGNMQNQARLQSDMNTLGSFRDMNSQSFNNGMVNSLATVAGAWYGNRDQNRGNSLAGAASGYQSHVPALNYAGY